MKDAGKETVKFQMKLPAEMRGEIKVAAARAGVPMNEWILETLTAVMEAIDTEITGEPIFTTKLYQIIRHRAFAKARRPLDPSKRKAWTTNEEGKVVEATIKDGKLVPLDAG